MKLHLARLFAGFSLLRFANSLSASDVAECDGHPDPHFRNFHGTAFDFQSGCDVVMVKNELADMEVHARLTQQGRYSAIEQVGVRIGTTTVVIKNDSTVMYNGNLWNGVPETFTGVGGTYTLQSASSGDATFISFPPRPGRRMIVDGIGGSQLRPDDFGIFVFTGFGQGGLNGAARRRLEDLRGGFMTFTIRAYGELLQGSQGLCGEWDLDTPGFADRDGNAVPLDPLYPGYYVLYDATDFGEGWRVTTPEDTAILSYTSVPDSSEWGAASCVPMDPFRRQRNLQLAPEIDCDRCYELSSLVGTLNCLYDAQVLDCDDPIVRGSIYDEGVFYGSGVDADVDLKCTDIAAAIDMATDSSSSKGSSKGSKSGRGGRVLYEEGRILRAKKGSKKGSKKSKSKGSKFDACEEIGGVCVVYCDVTSDDYTCLNGLCDVDIEYEDPVPVVAYDRFFTACSCKVPVATT